MRLASRLISAARWVNGFGVMGEPWALGNQTPIFFVLSKYKYKVKIAGSNPGEVQPLGECCGVYSEGILCCNGLSIDTHLMQATNPTNA